jgi:hypothetical protein
MPKKTPIGPELQSTLRTFDLISRKDYGRSFKAIVKDANKRRRSHRMRHLLGVAMKMKYSRIVSEQSGEVPHKWMIDPALLSKRSTEDWELRALWVSPERRTSESAKDVALRLHRETLLAKAFLKSIHQYICEDGVIRKQVKEILTEIGLNEFADVATPRGMIKMGAGYLLAYLTPLLSGIPAAGVAVATVVLCVLGLDAVCAASGDKK